ncbi:MAG: asparagine synthase-related protein [Janthinobacterium lividum]
MNTQLNRVPLSPLQIMTESPLVNQPLVELFLHLPSYVLTMDGVSRGFVRSASRGLLPEQIRTKFSKGSTSQFVTCWFHDARFREHLLNGQSVRSNYIDREALSRLFRNGCPFSVQQQLIDALPFEIWLRRFSRENHTAMNKSTDEI